MKTILFVGLMIVVNAFCLHAQTTEDIQKWKSVIEASDLPEIAQSIGHPGTVPWPKLISNSSMSLKGNAYKPSDLGYALLDKIRTYEKSISHQESDSGKAVAVYGTLSRGLQNSGGYINLCLADAANRLALARLSELLLNDPSLADKVKKTLANLTSVRLSTPQFVQMIHEEPAQKLKKDISLAPLEDTLAAGKIYAALGTTRSEIMVKFAYNQAGTNSLINDLQLGVLFARMAETDMIANVDLAGLIDFLQHGGKFSDLNGADIRPFQAIMSGRENLYKSDVLHVGFLGVDYLLVFIDEFKIDDPKNVFVATALQ